jgi:hypothetical protein
MKFKPEDLPLLDAYEWVGGDLVDVKKRPHGFINEDNVLTVSAEEGDGFADYYGEFRGGDPYIDPALEKWAEKRGHFWEWLNPGAIALYEN